MSEKNIDTLLSLTDSKYQLSVAIAKRAMQLKSGINPVVTPESRAGVRNLVTLAMRELATGKLEMGENLIDDGKLESHLNKTKAAQQAAIQEQQAGSYQMPPEFDND
jgi:DNA-directed RNA polymerase subunit omega